jgi:hypothetical protein
MVLLSLIANARVELGVRSEETPGIDALVRWFETHTEKDFEESLLSEALSGFDVTLLPSTLAASAAYVTNLLEARKEDGWVNELLMTWEGCLTWLANNTNAAKHRQALA